MKAFLQLLPCAVLLCQAYAAPVQTRDVATDLSKALDYVPGLNELHDLLGAVKAVNMNISKSTPEEHAILSAPARLPDMLRHAPRRWSSLNSLWFYY